MKRFAASLCLFSLLFCGVAWASPFASEVLVEGDWITDPCLRDGGPLLGKPHSLNTPYKVPYPPVTMIEPSWGVDPWTGQSKTCTISEWRYPEGLTVKFDHKVFDNSDEGIFGIDLIVFTKLMFGYGGEAAVPYPSPLPDEVSKWGFSCSPVTVSVSQDGETWFEVPVQANGETTFPTQAVKMHATEEGYSEFRDEQGRYRYWENNFTVPVDPVFAGDLSGNFGGKHVWEIERDIYSGSAGGTGIDFGATSLEWIQYVKLASTSGAVDAVSDVDPVLPDEFAVPSGYVNYSQDALSVGRHSFSWVVPGGGAKPVPCSLTLFCHKDGSTPVASFDLKGATEIEASFDLEGNRIYQMYVSFGEGADCRTGLWQFRTENSRPEIASFPTSGTELAQGVPLKWIVADPDGDKLARDGEIFFRWTGEAGDMQVYSMDIRSDNDMFSLESENLGPDFPIRFEPGRTYEWKLVFSENDGAAVASDDFHAFTVAEGLYGVELGADSNVFIPGDICMVRVDSKDLTPIGEALGLEAREILEVVSGDQALLASRGDVASEDMLRVNEQLQVDHVLSQGISFVYSGDAGAVDGRVGLFPVDLYYSARDLETLGLDPEKVLAGRLLDRLHLVKIVGDKAIDLVDLAGDDRDSLFTVRENGDGFSVRFNVAVRDGGEAGVWPSIGETFPCFAVNDGLQDGRLEDPLVTVGFEERQESGGGGCQVGPSMGAVRLTLFPLVLLLLKR